MPRARARLARELVASGVDSGAPDGGYARLRSDRLFPRHASHRLRPPMPQAMARLRAHLHHLRVGAAVRGYCAPRARRNLEKRRPVRWLRGRSRGPRPLGKAVPEGGAAKVRAEKARMEQGEDVSFAGPVFDQTGKVRIAAGSRASDQEVLTMRWFVRGVRGALPD